MEAPVDVYGNAQAIHPERRSLEIYQNDIQRNMLGGYQTFGRRIGQRGYEPFALPADQFMRTMKGRVGRGMTLPGGWRQRPSAFGLQETERKSAFSSYGGFGQRRSPYAPGDPEGALARKRSLIAATSSTAPIERSRLSQGGLGSLRFPIAQTPFQAPPAAVDGQSPPDGVPKPDSDSLSRFLTSGSEVLHKKAQTEGWKQFEAGDYRAAVRTFESAAMLDENDMESQIGEIFSYVAIGSLQAGSASLKALLRRDLNPFAHDISMNKRFGDAYVAQQVRLSAMGIAESSEQSAERKALAVFVLWYMDGHDDALRAARLLAAQDSNKNFAQWPELMQAARKKQP